MLLPAQHALFRLTSESSIFSLWYWAFGYCRRGKASRSFPIRDNFGHQARLLESRSYASPLKPHQAPIAWIQHQGKSDTCSQPQLRLSRTTGTIMVRFGIYSMIVRASGGRSRCLTELNRMIECAAGYSTMVNCKHHFCTWDHWQSL